MKNINKIYDQGTLVAITIATSAFVSFSLQPMIGKILLPQAGGSPATWNSAMMVYQGLLLAGYLWAAMLSKLAIKRQAICHVVLASACIFAAFTGHFLAPVSINGNAQELYYLVPASILQIAGLGMVFLFAQGPLLQSWYARIAPNENPYKLYIASNLGSFGGLVAYPVILEPYTDLTAQTLLYRGLFAGALIATMVIASKLLTDKTSSATATETPASGAAKEFKAKWIIIPFITTGMMMSITSHITTDIAAMPLTWAIPLGIYLLSYSFAFSDRSLAGSTRLTVFALVFLCAISFGGIKLNWLAVIIELACYAIVITMLHRQLYDARPAPASLTTYYLMMALGGTIAGISIGIVAPQIFNWIYELPLFIAAAVLTLKVTPIEGMMANRKITTFIWILAIFMALMSAAVSLAAQGTDYMSAIIAVIVALNAGALSGYTRKTVLTISGLAMLAGGALTQIKDTLSADQHRNYFGITRVVQTVDHGRKLQALMHGTTMHGVQVIGEQGRPTTTTYYGKDSGVTSIISAYQKPIKALVLGLGAGTTACTFPEGSSLTYIEIDPDMVDVARERFTFLKSCNVNNTNIIIGDGRKEMEKLPKGTYDVVLMDAFSSDSIPVHLITSEALDIARKVMKPDGVLVVHISNRYLDLSSMLATYAKTKGLVARVKGVKIEVKSLQASSDYVAIGTQGVMDRYAPVQNGWKEPQRGARLWTDNYSSVVQALR